MISDIIKTLQEHNFYGRGEYIDIAKGKNELVDDFKGFKRKARMIWQSRKR